MSAAIFRSALRCRAAYTPRAAPIARRIAMPAIVQSSKFSTTVRRADEHADETFEEFTTRYENEFNSVQDVFELQRNLNNAFAYDLVPAPSVIIAALKAARRLNDFPTAVRVFEGIKAKVENDSQYKEYLKELEPIRVELGISLKESLYPGGP